MRTSRRQTYLWRVMGRGGLQKGETPLVYAIREGLEKIAEVNGNWAPRSQGWPVSGRCRSSRGRCQSPILRVRSKPYKISTVHAAIAGSNCIEFSWYEFITLIDNH